MDSTTSFAGKAPAKESLVLFLQKFHLQAKSLKHHFWCERYQKTSDEYYSYNDWCYFFQIGINTPNNKHRTTHRNTLVHRNTPVHRNTRFEQNQRLEKWYPHLSSPFYTCSRQLTSILQTAWVPFPDSVIGMQKVLEHRNFRWNTLAPISLLRYSRCHQQNEKEIPHGKGREQNNK